MPVFNGGRFLIDAVASIIEQSCSDWELICINDGSTDHSPAILKCFAELDQRIRIVNQANMGIVAALNGGCAIARAPLICRMDCDDIALPHRLASQLAFMRNNPICVVVGGAILEIDRDGDPLGVSRLAANHDEILDQLLHRRTGHFHPATMIRASALEAVAGYRRKYQWVEDHDLWLRLSQRGTLANLPETVLCYRQHANSICWQRSQQQRDLMDQLMRDAYAARDLELPPELVAHRGGARAPAGPGKWLRSAAKGGYPRTACKHWQALLKSADPWTYKARMTLEATCRLAASTGRQWLTRSTRLSAPSFEDWHLRINALLGEVTALGGEALADTTDDVPNKVANSIARKGSRTRAA
jgi:hypothetical protein